MYAGTEIPKARDVLSPGGNKQGLLCAVCKGDAKQERILPPPFNPYDESFEL